MIENIYELDLQQVKNLSTLIADKLTQSVMSGDLKPGEHLVADWPSPWAGSGQS